MAKQSGRPLNDEQRMAVIAAYYLNRSSTVEEATAAMQQHHQWMSDQQAASAMQAASSAVASARAAEEQLAALESGEPIPLPETGEIVPIAEPASEEPFAVSEEEMGILPPSSPGFADVILRLPDGKVIQVRVEFGPGATAIDIDSLAREMARKEFEDSLPGASVEDATLDILGIYYQ